MGNVALACAWKARGEYARFERIYPDLTLHYAHIVVAMPPDSDKRIVQQMKVFPHVSTIITDDFATGRHTAIQHAAVESIEHVHYVDFERMVRWFETTPHEIHDVLSRIELVDCLIIGRTPHALSTHAQALQQTERIINAVFSHLLGQHVDLGGGSRGFSRDAVEYLMRHSPAGNAIGTDASWPMLLHRAGYRLATMAVDGLAWELPDHYRQRALDTASQYEAATAYDADASRWALRVQTALEIIEAGLNVADGSPNL